MFVGFTPFDGDFFGSDTVTWSDYILIHKSILDIVRRVGPWVFTPTAYVSMEVVSRYTNQLYKTMLQCAKDASTCGDFEMAAMDLANNAFTPASQSLVTAAFANFGNSEAHGSISAIVSYGQSVVISP
jgi:hypothetical protein